MSLLLAHSWKNAFVYHLAKSPIALLEKMFPKPMLLLCGVLIQLYQEDNDFQLSIDHIILQPEP